MLPKVIHTYQNHTLDSTRWDAYTPREDDIVIATSYKSGTTLTQEIVRQLVFLEGDAPSLNQVSPWLDSRLGPLDEAIDTLEEQQHRRFIKSHLALDGLPFYPQVKYIMVGRDPRDVFMSMWNHYANFTPQFYDFINNLPDRVGEPMPVCPEDIHEWWRTWITRGWFEWESEGYPMWGNMHHAATWWEYRSLPNILYVHYADLLANRTVEVQRIADFLEISVPAEKLSTVNEALSLNKMRRAAEAEAYMPETWKDGASTFFFKGTNGRWQEVLNDEEMALYEEKAASVLTPECRTWLEQGRTAWETPKPAPAQNAP